MDDWLQQGIPIKVIHLDFSKAFDSVPHQRLWYGILVQVITPRVFVLLTAEVNKVSYYSNSVVSFFFTLSLT